MKKFLPLTSTGEIGENFLLVKFLSNTVFTLKVDLDWRREEG